LLSAALVLVPAAGARPAVPAFRHVLVVVFENRERGQVLGEGSAPTFDAIARKYAVLSRYTGVAHPSLPNYLALVSGSTHGIVTDCTTCIVGGRNLADGARHRREVVEDVRGRAAEGGFRGRRGRPLREAAR